MKKFSVSLVAQALVLSVCTQAESWFPGIPEIKIPKIDFGWWGYLIVGILIIVVTIFVYRLVKWLVVGISEIATDGSKGVRQLREGWQKHDMSQKAADAAKWAKDSARTGHEKLREEWQKHDVSQKAADAATQAGQKGHNLWAKILNRRGKREPEKL